MFDPLQQHHQIFVTGPQRSGTRFIAKAICHDTGHAYLDEVKIATHSVYELLWMLSQQQTPCVIQCPGLCQCLPDLMQRFPDWFLVMCLRNEEDILASQSRIAWNYEWVERLAYHHRTDVLTQEILSFWPICRIKYAIWQADKHRIAGRYLEVRYDQMYTHPLWIPPAQRGPDWGFSQTEGNLCS